MACIRTATSSFPNLKLDIYFYTTSSNNIVTWENVMALLVLCVLIFLFDEILLVYVLMSY